MAGTSVELQIALLILLFFVGMAARRLGLAQPRHGGLLLDIVMRVGLPALFIANVSRLTLRAELLWLPGIAMAIMFACWGAAALCARAFTLARPAAGVFVISAMAINASFLFPFVIAAWGEAAFAQLALFDLGNAIMQCTVVYMLAASFGGHGTGAAAILKRVASFPPLWGLAIALLINVSGWQLPGPVVQVLQTGGRLILLLVIVALGVLFDLRRVLSGPVLTAVALRVALGFALGLIGVELLSLDGVTRAVVLLGAAAPVGFNVVVIANRESLDRELAASAASLSVALALVYVPLALWILRPSLFP